LLIFDLNIFPLSLVKAEALSGAFPPTVLEPALLGQQTVPGPRPGHPVGPRLSLPHLPRSHHCYHHYHPPTAALSQLDGRATGRATQGEGERGEIKRRRCRPRVRSG